MQGNTFVQDATLLWDLIPTAEPELMRHRLAVLERKYPNSIFVKYCRYNYLNTILTTNDKERIAKASAIFSRVKRDDLQERFVGEIEQLIQEVLLLLKQNNDNVITSSEVAFVIYRLAVADERVVSAANVILTDTEAALSNLPFLKSAICPASDTDMGEHLARLRGHFQHHLSKFPPLAYQFGVDIIYSLSGDELIADAGLVTFEQGLAQLKKASDAGSARSALQYFLFLTGFAQNKCSDTALMPRMANSERQERRIQTVSYSPESLTDRCEALALGPRHDAILEHFPNGRDSFGGPYYNIWRDPQTITQRASILGRIFAFRWACRDFWNCTDATTHQYDIELDRAVRNGTIATWFDDTEKFPELAVQPQLKARKIEQAKQKVENYNAISRQLIQAQQGAEWLPEISYLSAFLNWLDAQKTAELPDATLDDRHRLAVLTRAMQGQDETKEEERLIEIKQLLIAKWEATVTAQAQAQVDMRLTIFFALSLQRVVEVSQIMGILEADKERRFPSVNGAKYGSYPMTVRELYDECKKLADNDENKSALTAWLQDYLVTEWNTTEKSARNANISALVNDLTWQELRSLRQVQQTLAQAESALLEAEAPREEHEQSKQRVVLNLQAGWKLKQQQSQQQKSGQIDTNDIYEWHRVVTSPQMQAMLLEVKADIRQDWITQLADPLLLLPFQWACQDFMDCLDAQNQYDVDNDFQVRSQQINTWVELQFGAESTSKKNQRVQNAEKKVSIYDAAMTLLQQARQSTPNLPEVWYFSAFAHWLKTQRSAWRYKTELVDLVAQMDSPDATAAAENIQLLDDIKEHLRAIWQWNSEKVYEPTSLLSILTWQELLMLPQIQAMLADDTVCIRVTNTQDDTLHSVDLSPRTLFNKIQSERDEAHKTALENELIKYLETKWSQEQQSENGTVLDILECLFTQLKWPVLCKLASIQAILEEAPVVHQEQRADDDQILDYLQKGLSVSQAQGGIQLETESRDEWRRVLALPQMQNMLSTMKEKVSQNDARQQLITSLQQQVTIDTSYTVPISSSTMASISTSMSSPTRDAPSTAPIKRRSKFESDCSLGATGRSSLVRHGGLTGIQKGQPHASAVAHQDPDNTLRQQSAYVKSKGAFQSPEQAPALLKLKKEVLKAERADIHNLWYSMTVFSDFDTAEEFLAGVTHSILNKFYNWYNKVTEYVSKDELTPNLDAVRTELEELLQNVFAGYGQRRFDATFVYLKLIDQSDRVLKHVIDRCLEELPHTDVISSLSHDNSTFSGAPVSSSPIMQQPSLIQPSPILELERFRKEALYRKQHPIYVEFCGWYNKVKTYVTENKLGDNLNQVRTELEQLLHKVFAAYKMGHSDAIFVYLKLTDHSDEFLTSVIKSCLEIFPHPDVISSSSHGNSIFSNAFVSSSQAMWLPLIQQSPLLTLKHLRDELNQEELFDQIVGAQDFGPLCHLSAYHYINRAFALAGEGCIFFNDEVLRYYNLGLSLLERSARLGFGLAAVDYIFFITVAPCLGNGRGEYFSSHELLAKVDEFYPQASELEAYIDQILERSKGLNAWAFSNDSQVGSDAHAVLAYRMACHYLQRCQVSPSKFLFNKDSIEYQHAMRELDIATQNLVAHVKEAFHLKALLLVKQNNPDDSEQIDELFLCGDRREKCFWPEWDILGFETAYLFIRPQRYADRLQQGQTSVFHETTVLTPLSTPRTPRARKTGTAATPKTPGFDQLCARLEQQITNTNLRVGPVYDDVASVPSPSSSLLSHPASFSTSTTSSLTMTDVAHRSLEKPTPTTRQLYQLIYIILSVARDCHTEYQCRKAAVSSAPKDLSQQWLVLSHLDDLTHAATTLFKDCTNDNSEARLTELLNIIKTVYDYIGLSEAYNEAQDNPDRHPILVLLHQFLSYYNYPHERLESYQLDVMEIQHRQQQEMKRKQEQQLALDHAQAQPLTQSQQKKWFERPYYLEAVTEASSETIQALLVARQFIKDEILPPLTQINTFMKDLFAAKSDLEYYYLQTHLYPSGLFYLYRYWEMLLFYQTNLRDQGTSTLYFRNGISISEELERVKKLLQYFINKQHCMFVTPPTVDTIVWLDLLRNQGRFEESAEINAQLTLVHAFTDDSRAKFVAAYVTHKDYIREFYNTATCAYLRHKCGVLLNMPVMAQYKPVVLPVVLNEEQELQPVTQFSTEDFCAIYRYWWAVRSNPDKQTQCGIVQPAFDKLLKKVNENIINLNQYPDFEDEPTLIVYLNVLTLVQLGYLNRSSMIELMNHLEQYFGDNSTAIYAKIRHYLQRNNKSIAMDLLWLCEQIFNKLELFAPYKMLSSSNLSHEGASQLSLYNVIVSMINSRSNPPALSQALLTQFEQSNQTLFSANLSAPVGTMSSSDGSHELLPSKLFAVYSNWSRLLELDGDDIARNGIPTVQAELQQLINEITDLNIQNRDDVLAVLHIGQRNSMQTLNGLVISVQLTGFLQTIIGQTASIYGEIIKWCMCLVEEKNVDALKKWLSILTWGHNDNKFNGLVSISYFCLDNLTLTDYIERNINLIEARSLFTVYSYWSMLLELDASELLSEQIQPVQAELERLINKTNLLKIATQDLKPEQVFVLYHLKYRIHQSQLNGLKIDNNAILSKTTDLASRYNDIISWCMTRERCDDIYSLSKCLEILEWESTFNVWGVNRNMAYPHLGGVTLINYIKKIIKNFGKFDAKEYVTQHGQEIQALINRSYDVVQSPFYTMGASAGDVEQGIHREQSQNTQDFKRIYSKLFENSEGEISRFELYQKWLYWKDTNLFRARELLKELLTGIDLLNLNGLSYVDVFVVLAVYNNLDIIDKNHPDFSTRQILDKLWTFDINQLKSKVDLYNGDKIFEVPLKIAKAYYHARRCYTTEGKIDKAEQMLYDTALLELAKLSEPAELKRTGDASTFGHHMTLLFNYPPIYDKKGELNSRREVWERHVILDRERTSQQYLSAYRTFPEIYNVCSHQRPMARALVAYRMACQLYCILQEEYAQKPQTGRSADLRRWEKNKTNLLRRIAFELGLACKDRSRSVAEAYYLAAFVEDEFGTDTDKVLVSDANKASVSDKVSLLLLEGQELERNGQNSSTTEWQHFQSKYSRLCVKANIESNVNPLTCSEVSSSSGQSNDDRSGSCGSLCTPAPVGKASMWPRTSSTTSISISTSGAQPHDKLDHLVATMILAYNTYANTPLAAHYNTQGISKEFVPNTEDYWQPHWKALIEDILRIYYDDKNSSAQKQFAIVERTKSTYQQMQSELFHKNGRSQGWLKEIVEEDGAFNYNRVDNFDAASGFEYNFSFQATQICCAHGVGLSTLITQHLALCAEEILSVHLKGAKGGLFGSSGPKLSREQRDSLSVDCAMLSLRSLLKQPEVLKGQEPVDYLSKVVLMGNESDSSNDNIAFQEARQYVQWQCGAASVPKPVVQKAASDCCVM